MAYEVTARKWRPQEFDGVIGQEHVTTTLKNAILAGQVAHAYLFAGPRGVGKTTTARILAKALNCVNGPTVTPCNDCNICREISEGRSVDVLEIDGASNNRVEQVRTHLLESVKYTPSQGKHKIYIIDEVHMLTKEAFNALLKTLEEPPPHVYFIFATTDPRKVIPTVLSRCQRFDFRRISGPTIVDHLAMISEKSGYDVQREALALIARRVDGSMRDAESLLDQVVAFGGTGLTAREAAEVLGIVDQDVYFELLEIVGDQDVPRGLDLVDRVFRQGHDLEEIILGVLEHIRNLLVVKAAPEAEALLGAAALELDRYREQSGRFETEDLLRLSQLATQMEQSVKQSALPRVQLETGVVRMVRMARTVQLTDVMSRLSDLARHVDSGDGDGEAPAATPRKATDATASQAMVPPQVASSAAPGKTSEKQETSEAAPIAAAGASTGEAPVATPREAPLAEATPTAEAAATAAAIAPALGLKEVRTRWPAIVEEITGQRSGLGRLMAEAEISACSPADGARSGSAATITLSFGSKQVFHKEQAEKRDAAALIQSVCTNALGIPVRIACVIEDGDGTAEKSVREETATEETTAKETLESPSADQAARKTAGARSGEAGVAKDPVVRKIVEAFDGQIVAD